MYDKKMKLGHNKYVEMSSILLFILCNWLMIIRIKRPT